MQAICDRLGPGTINVFVQRWLHRLPMPLGPKDHDADFWWETSMRQVEISRTIVFDAPRHARGLFEALVADNLNIGRPHNVEIIFARKSAATPRGWLCRNCRQVASVCRCGAGGIFSALRTRRIVDAPTRWPSFRSSPWIRWYPQL